MDIRNVLIDGLRKFRDQQTVAGGPVSQRAYAEFLGVSHPSVMGWMNGKRLPERQSLLIIADKLAPLIGYDVYERLDLKSVESHQISEIRSIYKTLPEEKQDELYNEIIAWLKENGFYRDK